MKIRYGVEVPGKGHKRLSEASSAIVAFIDRGEASMEMSFDTQKEAMRARGTANAFIHNRGLSNLYDISIRRTKVYVFRKGE